MVFKDLIYLVFGEGTDLTVLQMGLRAAVIFIITLILIRFGRRAFGMGSPFDNVITILLGAILSRGVTGASPFLPILSAAFIIVIIHQLFAWLSFRFKLFGKLVEGKAKPLYRDGRFIQDNMDRFFITEDDFKETLRQDCNTDDLQQVKEAYMERNGKISIVKNNR